MPNGQGDGKHWTKRAPQQSAGRGETTANKQPFAVAVFNKSFRKHHKLTSWMSTARPRHFSSLETANVVPNSLATWLTIQSARWFRLSKKYCVTGPSSCLIFLVVCDSFGRGHHPRAQLGFKKQAQQNRDSMAKTWHHVRA